MYIGDMSGEWNIQMGDILGNTPISKYLTISNTPEIVAMKEIQ